VRCVGQVLFLSEHDGGADDGDGDPANTEAGVRGPEVEAGDAQVRRGRDGGRDHREGQQAEGGDGRWPRAPVAAANRRRRCRAKLDQKISDRLLADCENRPI
jgi:hypothetical protein